MANPKETSTLQRRAAFIWDDANNEWVAQSGNSDGTLDIINISALVPKTHDYIALTYISAGDGTGEIETATYKTGGSGGTTVAILTLTYDGSNRLSTVTRT